MSAARRAPAPPRVLVLGADPVVIEAVRDALGTGTEVVVAPDPEAGLASSGGVPVDLVIVDGLTAAGTGENLVRSLRQIPEIAGAAIRILGVDATDVRRLELLQEGVNDYLTSPFTADELRRRADNLILLQRAEERLRALRVRDDRARIARDLHDLVIQDLFAAGTRLQSIAPLVEQPAARRRVVGVINDLDRVIVRLRSTIFDLKRSAATEGLRAEATALTVEAADRLGCIPRISYTGAIDTLVDDEAAANLLAVLQEALSNVVRHSGATFVEVSIDASTDDVVLAVHDDGTGAAAGAPGGQGLRNMAERAENLGGTCTVTPVVPRGTEVRRTIPLHSGG